MKLFLALVTLLGTINAFAQSKIQNWKDSYKVLQTDAVLALENYYYQDAIWEDEGYFCGGDFSNFKLVSKDDEKYTISGNVTYAQNYCQYTSIASFVVEMYSKDNKLEINEIEFNGNN